MYNYRPYGQPGQPVRPSYNMLFSHFKQLGYSDELAGAEANRIMLQTNAYNQMSAPPPPTAQYPPTPYQNFNFNAPNYQYNNTFNQQQAYTHPTTVPTQHQIQTPVAQPTTQPSTQHANFNKNNLLSGVKLASRPSTISAFNAASNQSSNESQTNPIKFNLKKPDPVSVQKPFHNTIPPQPGYQANQPVHANYQQPQPPMGYPVAHHTPGYAANQPTGYHVTNTPQGLNTHYSSVPHNKESPKNNLSSLFYIDTKGQKFNKNAQEDATPKFTIDQVNKWIQELYVHLNMTTSSKKLRAAVNVYIQHILEQFRAGKLTKNDLRMLSPEEIMDFKKTKDEPVVEPPVEKTKHESDEEASRKLLQTSKGKKKQVKTKRSDESSSHKPKFEHSSKVLDSLEIQRREQRSQRFKTTQPTPLYNFNPVKNKSIVGLSQELEKTYLRLTSEPNPMMVRPENVLIQSFKFVFDKFLSNKNYIYIQEQFRSIRQDIQVQHIRTPFVVNLYTTNARLALLHNDLDQFNQCQTQLKHLLKCFNEYQTVKVEFELYYILYLSLQNMNMDLLRYLKENYVSNTNVTPRTTSEKDTFKNSMYFKFANLVRLSISDENFIQYFKLADTKDINYDYYLNLIYKQAFNSDDGKKDIPPFDDGRSLFYCKLLFKMFESKFRMFSIYTLCRSSLTLSTDVLVDLINFKNKKECLEFLREHKAVFNDSGLIDCKQTLSVIVESPLMRSKKI